MRAGKESGGWARLQEPPRLLAILRLYLLPPASLMTYLRRRATSRAAAELSPSDCPPWPSSAPVPEARASTALNRMEACSPAAAA